jgi:hypothetical protein
MQMRSPVRADHVLVDAVLALAELAKTLRLFRRYRGPLASVTLLKPAS